MKFAESKTAAIPTKGFVDIYCILSRAMFYDLSTGEVIDGERAREMLQARDKATDIGYLSQDAGIKVRAWKDYDSLISGRIYLW